MLTVAENDCLMPDGKGHYHPPIDDCDQVSISSFREDFSKRPPKELLPFIVNFNNFHKICKFSLHFPLKLLGKVHYR